MQGLLLRRETQSASTKENVARENENALGSGCNLFQRPVRRLIRRGNTCKGWSMLLQSALGKATGKQFKHTTTARRCNRRTPPRSPVTTARHFCCNETIPCDDAPVARGKMQIPDSMPRHFWEQQSHGAAISETTFLIFRRPAVQQQPRGLRIRRLFIREWGWLGGGERYLDLHMSSVAALGCGGGAV